MIIPEVILHGNEDEIKSLMLETFLSAYVVSFLPKYPPFTHSACIMTSFGGINEFTGTGRLEYVRI